MGAIEDDIDANLRELRQRNRRSHTLKDSGATWDEIECTVCERKGGVDLSFNHCRTVSMIVPDGPMTLESLFQRSLSRAEKWHPKGLNDWSALEWGGAMAGEAGEACNAAKKLKRLESEMPTINAPERSFKRVEQAKQYIANECADTILYALLMMARVGVTDPASIIRGVFNTKSEEYGFPERV